MPNLPKLMISSPFHLPFGQSLLRRARKRPKLAITSREYDRLLREWLATRNAPAGSLMHFFYGNVRIVKDFLAHEGIAVLPPVYPRQLAFKLQERGFARLDELKAKIETSKRRQSRKAHGKKSPKEHIQNFSN